MCQGTARAGIKNGNSAEYKALLLGLIAASLVLPLSEPRVLICHPRGSGCYWLLGVVLGDGVAAGAGVTFETRSLGLESLNFPIWQAFKKRRCLIPANGFHEWKKVIGGI